MKTKQVSHEFCLALDLAKRSAQAAVAPMSAREKDWKTFPTHSIAAAPESSEAIADLAAWVAQATERGAVCRCVVVEATGNISKRFARALAASKRFPRVNIVNPARSKAYLVSQGVRDKSDPIDAAALALYGARSDLDAPRLLSRAEEQLRELSRLREQYVGVRTMWKNRLGESDNKVARERIRHTIADLEKTIAHVDRDILKVLESDPALVEQVKWLQTIKGIKRVVAVILTAELGDLRLYTRGEIVAVAGLFARTYVSGETVYRRPRLALGGGGHVRRALYLAATSLFRSKGELREYIEKRVQMGVAKMKIVGALMRKLLLIARAVVKAGGQYRPELIGREQPVG